MAKNYLGVPGVSCDDGTGGHDPVPHHLKAVQDLQETKALMQCK